MAQLSRDIIEIARCSTQYRADHFAPMGLKSCHGSYLWEVCRNPGISQDKLAKRICFNKSNIARQADALEDAAVIAGPPVPDSWLLDAMKGLPEKYRICLYLYYYEEYSAREIGAVMGVSESAVGQYLTRGRRKLRAIIADEERRLAL